MSKNDYELEFKNEVKRQLCHLNLKKGYLQHRLDTDVKEESAQQRAKANVEMDALNQKISELEMFDAWLDEH